MTDDERSPQESNLCKDCVFRFRRVFIPRNPEHFVDEDGVQLLEDGESIVIMNMCLISDMDLELDFTVDCTHYRSNSEEDIVDVCEKISIFKHLNKD